MIFSERFNHIQECVEEKHKIIDVPIITIQECVEEKHKIIDVPIITIIILILYNSPLVIKKIIRYKNKKYKIIQSSGEQAQYQKR